MHGSIELYRWSETEWTFSVPIRRGKEKSVVSLGTSKVFKTRGAAQKEARKWCKELGVKAARAVKDIDVEGTCESARK